MRLDKIVDYLQLTNRNLQFLVKILSIMSERITRRSNYLYLLFSQVNTKLGCTFILMLFFNLAYTQSANPQTSSPESTCPPVDIIIEPIANICLNGNSPLVCLVATVEGGVGTGVGVWAGQGVIGDKFDPSLAAIGGNEISYTFVENGCVTIETYTIYVYFTPGASFTVTSPICGDDVSDIQASPVSGGTYDWDFDGGTILSGYGPGPYEISWPDSGSYTVSLLITDANGCTSNLVNHVVDVVAPLEPPVIDCNTDTSMITFSWDDVDNALGYNISIITGPTGVLAGNTYTISPLNPNDSVTIELTVLGDAPCGDISIIQTCYATDCSDLTANAGPDGMLSCRDSFVIIQSNGSSTGPQYLYVWEGPLDSTQVNEPNPFVSVPGTYVLTIFDTLNNCASSPDTVEIGMNGNPPVATILNHDSDTIDCLTPTLTLTGAQVPNANYLWTDQNGLPVGTGSGISVMVGVQGIYFFNVLDTINGCTGVDSIEVLVDKNLPLIVFTLPDDLSCSMEEVQLNATGSQTGPAIITKWTGGNISGPDDELITTVIAPGVYNLSLTDTLNGCESDSNLIVNQIHDEPIAAADVSENLDCNTFEVEISGLNSTGTGPLTFQWFFDTTLIAEEESTAVREEGTYVLVVTDQDNNCTDTTYVDVLESINSLNEAVLQIVEPSCHGENDAILYIEEVVGGTPPYSYSINSSDFTDTNLIDSLTAGSYTLTIVDQEDCSWNTPFTIYDPPDLALQLGGNQILQLGENTTISAQFNISEAAIDSLVWTPTNMLTCLDSITDICSEVYAFPLSNLLVTATLTDTNGCSVQDEVFLRIKRDSLVFIPNIFTPNGDQENDVFMIFSSRSVEKINHFLVYDRWGEIMYEQHDFSPDNPAYGWDGTLKGKPLSPAVFVYWADVQLIGGRSVIFKGDVTLLR